MELFNSIEFFDGIQQFIALVVAVIVHRKDFVLILFKTRKPLLVVGCIVMIRPLFNILVKTFLGFHCSGLALVSIVSVSLGYWFL